MCFHRWNVIWGIPKGEIQTMKHNLKTRPEWLHEDKRLKDWFDGFEKEIYEMFHRRIHCKACLLKEILGE